MFKTVKAGPPDPMYALKRGADADTAPGKVDLGVGIYRNEAGQYHELEAIKLVRFPKAMLHPVSAKLIKEDAVGKGRAGETESRS